MVKPYCLLTEAQKVLRRAAKKRWRDRNRAKQRALTKAWRQKNRDRVNKQFRDRYAANPELYRAKLKAKRERMGEKYRLQIKRSRTKTRSTPEGMLYHRMSQSVRSALLGARKISFRRTRSMEETETRRLIVTLTGEPRVHRQRQNTVNHSHPFHGFVITAFIRS